MTGTVLRPIVETLAGHGRSGRMGFFYWIVILFLLLNLLLGLVRVVRGPKPADRVLAAQLFGTMGVAILLLLAQAQEESALRDVGLVLALAAPLVAISFAGASERE